MKYSIIGIALCCKLGMTATNPIVTDMFTADPGALVHNDTVYIYTGHDEASPNHQGYVMNNWYIFSSGDMDTWENRGEALSIHSFNWIKGSAWASHAIERNGKFYWYVTGHDGSDFAIGVAVADHPAGPYHDALGHALIKGSITGPEVNYDIDPAVFIDDDGQAYIYWGNGAVKGFRLKENMIETEGPMFDITPPFFTEAAYMHKRKDYYFLTYAYGWEERIGQSTAKSPLGPVSNSKVIVDYNINSNTSHQAIIEFHNQWYYIYHTGVLGGSFRRALSIDYMYYDNDSTIANIEMTTAGVKKVDHSPIKDGVYRIKAKHSNLYLDQSSHGVVQNTLDTNWNQLWVIQQVEGNSYTLRNLLSSQYMSFDSKELLDTLKLSNTLSEVNIENFNIEDGYRIYADTSSEYLADVLNISQEPNMPLIVYKQTGTLNQSFLFELMGDESDFTDLTAKYSNKSQESQKHSSLQNNNSFLLEEASSYIITDLRGRVIKQGFHSEIQLSDIPKGKYILQINSTTSILLIN